MLVEPQGPPRSSLSNTALGHLIGDYKSYIYIYHENSNLMATIQSTPNFAQVSYNCQGNCKAGVPPFIMGKVELKCQVITLEPELTFQTLEVSLVNSAHHSIGVAKTCPHAASYGFDLIKWQLQHNLTFSFC